LLSAGHGRRADEVIEIEMHLLQCMSLFLAQMRSADCITQCLVLVAKRKPFSLDEHFAF
jgi:hypothetical protein